MRDYKLTTPHQRERRIMLHHLPRLIFSGDIPASTRETRSLDGRPVAVNRIGLCSYIYHLFDQQGEPMYFGKTNQPSYRFEKHRRRPWWSEVAHLNLYIVTCESHLDEPCKGFGDNPRSTLERAATLWERKAILDIQPRYNIAGVTA